MKISMSRGGILGFLIVLHLIIHSCKENKNVGEGTIASQIFVEVSSHESGIHFENSVVQEGENNILNYSYFFNGGGVALMDINNDSLQDIYFTGNMVENKLYLNKGNLHFEDISQKAGVACTEGWKTGVTVVDINKDGWLDLYVCRSAMSDTSLRKNLLFINNQDLTFSEQGAIYGLADMGYSTQAAFFDYDRDGDEDAFIINHSLPEYSKFSYLKQHLITKGNNFSPRLYKNENGYFRNVSDQAGIVNNVLSFGLGLAISDINQDGWLDVYVSNDFNEQDYLYINNKNGTFTNKVHEATDHISIFSMGSDIADINNDLLPDLITLDMMPHSNKRIKLSSGDDNYDKNQILEEAGLHHQTMRNMLHINNGDGTFSEIGQLMGVSNTDWSWASLLIDFDGDCLKDLYISNGYEKDFTNMQFLKFTVDAQLKSRQTGQPLDMNQILANIPSIEEGNFIFKNKGDKFENKSVAWGMGRKFKSNGAASADLDNDGDPDLVINVINQKSIILKNSAVENKINNFISIDLTHVLNAIPVIGTKIKVYAGDTAQYFEFSPVRGFQSTAYTPLNIGIGKSTLVDSIKVTWQDQKMSSYYNVMAGVIVKPKYSEAILLPQPLNTPKPFFTTVSQQFDWKHSPSLINDFKQQLLLPKMYSYPGPKMSIADVNDDRLEDVFIAAGPGQPSSLWVQNMNGKFILGHEFKSETAVTNACFFDADMDGDQDLFMVNGGYNLTNKFLQDHLYLNNGKGRFTLSNNALPGESHNGAIALPIDIDQDQDVDLFIGNNIIPGSYPLYHSSQFLLNDGKGNFQLKNDLVEGVDNLGIVNTGITLDLNRDNKQDLIIAGEWSPIRVFINLDGKLRDKTTDWIKWPSNGWWNVLTEADFDNDGDSDIMAGNSGINNQYKVSTIYPLTLVYKDFDKNNQIDPFLCYFIDGVSYPYASRDEALGQVGFLRSRFLDYNSYATATIHDIFSEEELNDAQTLRADILESVYLENTGNELKPRTMPVQFQYAPLYSILPLDIDQDDDLDIVSAGNECNVRVRLGRSDANKGFVFINDSKGNFTYLNQSYAGLSLKDDTRSLQLIRTKKSNILLIGQTSKPLLTYQLN